MLNQQDQCTEGKVNFTLILPLINMMHTTNLAYINLLIYITHLVSIIEHWFASTCDLELPTRDDNSATWLLSMNVEAAM